MELLTQPPNYNKLDLPLLRQRVAWHFDRWQEAKRETIYQPDKKLYNLIRWLAEVYCIPAHDRDLGALPTGYFARIENLELRASFDGWKPVSVRVRYEDGSSDLVYQASENNRVKVYRPGHWEDMLAGVG